MAWTSDQQAAIDKRDANILVSAAAGSGKTAVLTERVMKRIIGQENEPPIEIDRFLIVTFTSAAAQEMKERIMNKLSDYMSELQEKGNIDQVETIEQMNYLEKQMALVHKASISTIHSFCLKTIKSYFNELDIDPNIKVGNEAELSMMKMEILEELIEEKFEVEDPDFLEIAEVYGNVQGMAPLVKLLLEIDTFSKSTPFPKVWLREQVHALMQPYEHLSQTPWAEAIKTHILKQINDLKIIYKEAITLCKAPNGPYLYEPLLEADLLPIVNIDEDSPLEMIISAVKEISFAALPRKKQECDESIKERVKEYRDLVKDVVKGLQGDLAFMEDPRLMEQLPQIGRLMGHLINLIDLFNARYEEAKRDASLVDYNDLEHLCLRLLIKPEFNEDDELIAIHYTDIAKELSVFYREVYIDEYQDSNTVQETLLQAVAEAADEEGPTRFMVGDMKQSIYRFRLANPLIFAKKYQEWEKHTKDKESTSKDVCIDLSQNFRSRDNILQGTNDIFEQIMSPTVGDIEYDDYARLKVGNHYTDGKVEKLPPEALADTIELHLLETKEAELEEGEEGSLEELKNVECEALMVAHLIDKLLKGEGNPTHVYDKDLGDYRKIEARDIVILLRATKDKAELFETALIQKGIGAYADVSSNFFDALEVQTMISLLKVIDNPLQDIPLLTVLRSPMVGLTLDDLVIIRKTQEEGCFYEALKVYVQLEEANQLAVDFIRHIEAYREESIQLTIEELMAKLYVDTGYYRYVSMLPTGSKKKANLILLKKYAEQFEVSQNGKLFSFLQYLDKLRETTDGIGQAKLTSDNENLVRIMSIHKSKGLEFSVVFLADTGKKFNNNDIMKTVLMHNDLGLGPDYTDQESFVKYPTIPRMAIKNQIISENISEEMRVLYVALTRAKEKLFITGTLSELDKAVNKWSLFGLRHEKEILPLGVRRAGSYLNWIGLSLFAHHSLPELHERIGMPLDYVFEGQSKWQLTVWDKKSLEHSQQQGQREVHAKKDLLEHWDAQKIYGDYKEEIMRRLDFTYAHEGATTLPTKLSVSELKRRAQRVEIGNEGETRQIDLVLTQITDTPKEEAIRVPSFIQKEEELKGAQRGTLIHSIFEQLDFLRFQSAEEIEEELKRLVMNHQIQAEALELVNISRFVSLAHSSYAVRMKEAKHLWKEKPFVYLVQASKVDETYPEDEEILIQGIIDTFFIDEENEITIIDYKTDYVDLSNKVTSIEKIRKRYKKQLDLYGEALESITRLKVREKVVYLYSINEWIEM